MREFYTITESDVGQCLIHAFNRYWAVMDHWGRTQPRDVGKRVYQTSPGVLQIENEQQFNKRMDGKTDELVLSRDDEVVARVAPRWAWDAIDARLTAVSQTTRFDPSQCNEIFHWNRAMTEEN